MDGLQTSKLLSGPCTNIVYEGEFYCQAQYERGKRWIRLFTTCNGNDLSSLAFSKLYIAYNYIKLFSVLKFNLSSSLFIKPRPSAVYRDKPFDNGGRG